ncbi:MAG: TlpA family protein disulfide reductase [Deltaproteobacteria bacterium]|nr:MAG: TlpA family protein disulfide reductase [Deltaproteobacteria bacterium]
MKYLRYVLPLLIISLVFGALSNTPAQPDTKIVVERIEPSKLDELINNKDCQCLIIAMAAWCGPCKEELQTLIKLNDKYKSQGLKMIGISLDMGGPQAMQPIVETFGVNFPVYWAGDEAIYKYNVIAMPTLFMVKNGEIVERIVGKRSDAFLDEKIRGFLR